MRYRLVYVGRRAPDPLVLAAQGYAERLQHYVQLTQHMVRETGDVRAETAALKIQLERQPKGAYAVALTERGKTLSTASWAQQVQAWQQQGQRDVTYLLGGAGGLSPALVRSCPMQLSLSALTLPHRLALVVLLEQLYRVHTILRGEPYHRA